MVAAGIDVRDSGSMIVTIADQDKEEALPIVRQVRRSGLRIYATEGTAKFLNDRAWSAREPR